MSSERVEFSNLLPKEKKKKRKKCKLIHGVGERIQNRTSQEFCLTVVPSGAFTVLCNQILSVAEFSLKK